MDAQEVTPVDTDGAKAILSMFRDVANVFFAGH